MGNRARLWASVKAAVGYLGLGLLLTVGLPLITRFVPLQGGRFGFLHLLEQAGHGFLPVAPLLLVFLTGWQWWQMRRHQGRINRAIAEQGVTYLLLPRPDAPPTRSEQVTIWQRMSQLLPTNDHLSFELTSKGASQVFSMRASNTSICRTFLTKVMTEFPGTEVRRVDDAADPLTVPPAQFVIWQELVPTHREQPLVSATANPLLGVLGELATLSPGVQAGLQLLVRADRHTRYHLVSKAAQATSKQPDSGPYAVRPSNEAKRDVQALDQRAQATFVEAQVIVWASAADEATARQTAQYLADSLRGQYQAHNPLRRGASGQGSRVRRDLGAFHGTAWTAQEAGTLAHLLGSESVGVAPQLVRARSRALPAASVCQLVPAKRIAPFLAQLRAADDGLTEILLVDEVTLDSSDDSILAPEAN